jgi:hypothetical protein
VNAQQIHAVIVACLASVAGADTNVWRGANTTNGASAQVSVDDPSLWSLGWVPTTGDTAAISFDSTNTAAHLYIPATSAFAPSALLFRANGNPANIAQTNWLFLDKSLTLSNLTMTVCNGTGSTRDNGRLRIGMLSTTGSPVVLTLTGDGEALNIAGSPKTVWPAIIVGLATCTIDFQGTNITFSKGSQTTGVNAPDCFNNGSDTDNAAAPSNSTVKFSADSAVINLADQGIRGATLGPGFLNLAVCTGQTWNAEQTAYVKFFYRAGVVGSPGPDIVQCLNGSRLDNLGLLNITLGRLYTSGGIVANQATLSATKATGMRLVGGTYGSLRLAGGITSLRDNYVVLKGDVTLRGRAIAPPAVVGSTTNPATATDAGLILDTGTGVIRTSWYLDTGGYALALSNSLRITDATASVTSTVGNVVGALLIATDSTVTVGGDLVVHSDNLGPWAAPTSRVTRAFGISGNAGTVLNLGGSYSNDCVSATGRGLSQSTVNLVGGSALRTFEVGDAWTNATVKTNSFSIETLNVGYGACPANVRLVNFCLNDNPIVQSNANDKLGEKLVVGNLNVGARSTLDANGQFVQIATALSIAPDAWLDLKSGQTLKACEAATNFFGEGDRTAAWLPCSGRVLDASNPGGRFVPAYVLSANRTYWQMLPRGGAAIVCY